MIISLCKQKIWSVTFFTDRTSLYKQSFLLVVTNIVWKSFINKECDLLLLLLTTIQQIQTIRTICDYKIVTHQAQEVLTKQKIWPKNIYEK